MRVHIVAEIGCNHNGDINLAKKMIVAAKECGVDAVKFQTFDSSALISQYAPKAEYQKITTGTAESQLEMTRKLELSKSDYIELKAFAIQLGLEVFSTPFDMESIDFLYKNGQNIWKIPSGEITNLPYLQKIGNLECNHKKIILSSGMSTIAEIQQAVDILTENKDSNQIILLHCNTEYPTPDADVNLSAIDELAEIFPKMKLGFSDHSVGSVAAIGAVMKNIVFLEKHFTLDKNMKGPDHKASATPEELKDICVNVRRLEQMIGCGKKIVTESEKKNRVIARKSITAKMAIKTGEIFTEDNICCKRPGSGISPMYWYDVIGKKAENNFKYDELIQINEIKNQE